MRVICMAAAVSSRTCCCPGRARWRFCAARWRTDASRASSSPSGCDTSVFVREDLPNAADIVARNTVPGYRLSRCPPLAHGKVRFVGEAVAMCVAATRAEAEDLCEQVELDDRGAAGARRCACRARRQECARPRRMARQHFSHAQPGQRLCDREQGRAGRGHARDLAVAAGHGADGRQGRACLLGRAHRPAHALHLDPGASHHSRRHRAVSRHPAGAGARHLARRGRRLRLQMRAAARKSCASPGSRSNTARPSVTSRIAASTSSPAPTRASIITPHRLCRARGRAQGARCRDHHRRRRLFQLAVHGRRSSRGKPAATCPARTTSAAIAAAPIASRPTSRASCRTAASRAPACASPWS